MDHAGVNAPLGYPRLHLRLVDSTNERARRLALSGAPHGTLVTAAEQSAGRGRQGRTWSAPAGRAILSSVIVRHPPRLLPLAAGVAVADAVQEVLDGALAGGRWDPAQSHGSAAPRAAAPSRALLKWPNDVLVDGRKLAGILVEGRPQEGWAVVGTGVNVAVRESDLPLELSATAGTLGLEPEAVEPTLERLLRSLDRWLAASTEEVLEALQSRDALRGQSVRWAGGEGEASGMDGEGRLLVTTEHGQVALDAGEVHLVRP